MELITIRGHHLPHLAGFLHYGRLKYQENPEFDQRVIELFEKIRSNPDIRVLVNNSLDDICKLCNKKTDEDKAKECEFGGEGYDNSAIKIFRLEKRKTYSQRKFIHIVSSSPKMYWF